MYGFIDGEPDHRVWCVESSGASIVDVPQDDAAIVLSDFLLLLVLVGDDLVLREEFFCVIGALSHRAVVVLRALLGRCNPGALLFEQLTAIEQLGCYVVVGFGVLIFGYFVLVRLEWLVVVFE